MLGQAIDLRANDADYLPLSAGVNIPATASPAA